MFDVADQKPAVQCLMLKDAFKRLLFWDDEFSTINSE